MPQVADMLLKFLLLDRDPTNEPVVDARIFSFLLHLTGILYQYFSGSANKT
jgi:hypothetical protein